MPDPDTDILRQGWFGDLPDALATVLLGIGRWQDFERGDPISTAGSSESSMVGLSAGSVRMDLDLGGQRRRFAHLFGPGAWMGDYALVTGHVRLVDLVACEAGRLLRVKAEDFRQAADAHPGLWQSISMLLAENVRLAMVAAQDLQTPNARDRMLSLLLRLSGRRGGYTGTAPIDRLAVGQQELADSVNLSRASAGRLLRQFAAEGLLSLEYGAVVLRDPDAMARELAAARP